MELQFEARPLPAAVSSLVFRRVARSRAPCSRSSRGRARSHRWAGARATLLRKGFVASGRAHAKGRTRTNARPPLTPRAPRAPARARAHSPARTSRAPERLIRRVRFGLRR
eukprot:713056-Pleurochrysis_carterae.AAC.1